MDQRNILIAIVLSLGILLTFEYFFAVPQREQAVQQAEQQAQQAQSVPPAGGEPAAIPVPSAGEGAVSIGAPAAGASPSALAGRETVLSEGGRVIIESPTISGSISLVGGRLDDLVLSRYRETVNPDSPSIVLLWPVGTTQPYFVNFG